MLGNSWCTTKTSGRLELKPFELLFWLDNHLLFLTWFLMFLLFSLSTLSSFSCLKTFGCIKLIMPFKSKTINVFNTCSFRVLKSYIISWSWFILQFIRFYDLSSASSGAVIFWKMNWFLLVNVSLICWTLSMYMSAFLNT